jgi:osmotically-inducible protein OsmY
MESAKSRLQASPYLPLAKVTCDYEDGVLLLRGRLPDFYHKQLAQHAVAEIPGVTQVVNDTEVVTVLA